MRAPSYSVVLPCYNEEGAIRQTIEQLLAKLPAATPFELIVVDDGSTDGSAALLAGLHDQDPRFRVLRHARNLGYGAALKTGILAARGAHVVITDADGTYPNERIPELVALAREADMVVGARVASDVVYPWLRALPKAFLRTYASWLSRQQIPDLNSGLRVFRRDVALRFLPILPDTFSFTTTITIALHTNRYHVVYHPIGYAPRVGKSKIRPIRDTLNFIKLIVRTGTYFAPMRVFFPIAVALMLAFLVSLAVDVFYYRNLTDKTLLFVLFSLNTGMFALLADMIDKRSPVATASSAATSSDVDARES